MGKLKRRFGLVAVNLIVVVVLCEAVSVATFYFWTGEFFYTRSANHGHSPLASINTLTSQNAEQGAVQQLHPYFGFIDKVGIDHRFAYSQSSHVSNNFGFASNYRYPFKRLNSNQFIVGVFGGSTAANYAFFEIERSILAAALKRLPALKDKEVIILPFAIGAYKQPQQLLVLSYFLSIGQDFDLVVNVDGFNEVALSYLNYQHGIESSMPSDFILLPMVNRATGNLSKEEHRLTAEILEEKEKLIGSIDSLNEAHTASGYLIGWVWARHLERSYQLNVARLSQLGDSRKLAEQSYMQIPVTPPMNEDEAFARMVALWSRSSLMMKRLLDQQSIPYFQFIQPNQYAATRRVFSAEERTIAVNDANPFKTGVVRGYPLLLAELGKLQQAGVNAFSAVNVFDDVSPPVYGDDCCHYNEAGNAIFSKHVAGIIEQTLSKDGRFDQPAAPGK